METLTMESLNVYLVGGAVRDLKLEIPAKDKDFVVIGSNTQEMTDLGFTLIGKRNFPVFLHPETKEEWALARTEKKVGVGYHGFIPHADELVTLEEDLSRRDLTINSMALSDTGELIDPFNGMLDLENKILRHTTDAFVEDPLRVLRVARFLARYGKSWTIHPTTLKLMKKISESGELKHLTPERVWLETEKALMEDNPELYFSTLNGLGVFPEIESMVSVPQSPIQHPEGDVFTHTMLVLRRSADLGFDLETRFAALTHDFGKAPNFIMHGHLNGHEKEGVSFIEDFCKRLKVPKKLQELAMLTCENHTRCHLTLTMRTQKVHKLIVDDFKALVHQKRFKQFLQVCQCDAQGVGDDRASKPYLEKDILQSLLNSLLQLDRKDIVIKAIEAGKKGKRLGALIKEAEIKVLNEELAKFKSK